MAISGEIPYSALKTMVKTKRTLSSSKGSNLFQR